MLLRITLIFSFMLLSFSICQAAPIDEIIKDETIKGKRFNFQFRASEISNIMYQLNCMAGITTGSGDAYKELWVDKLQWSSADDKELAKWLQLWLKYNNSLDFVERSDRVYQYPLNYPYVLNLTDKLQMAGLQAGNITEYRHNLEFIVTTADGNEFVRIIQHFQPRFHSWWNSEAKAHAEQALASFTMLIKQRSLLEYAERVAALYGSEIPDQHVIFFSLMPRPIGKGESLEHIHTNGNQVENHSIIEIIKDEKPEQEIDIVFHELFHYFYALVPTEKHFELLNSFLKADADNALGLYSILDESIATAIANGLLAEMLRDKERFAKFLLKDGSLYGDRFIDKDGKAIMRILERRIAEGRSILDGFTDEYIRVVTQALGENSNSPLLNLKSRGIVYFGNELRPLADQFHQSVRGIQTTTVNAKAKWPFEQHPALSGVVILHSRDIQQLSNYENMLGKDVTVKLVELTKKYQGFIYAVRKTAKTTLYLFIGDDSAILQEMMSSFVKSHKSFDGVGYETAR